MIKKISFEFKKIPPIGAVTVQKGKGPDTEFVRIDRVHVIEIGTNELKEVTHKRLAILVRKLIQLALSKKVRALHIDFSLFAPFAKKIKPEWIAELIAINAELANYRHIRFKTEPKEGWSFIERIIVTGADKKSLRDAFMRGQVIGSEINACREISNTPGGDMTPRLLAAHAQKSAEGTGISVEVLGVNEMKKLGMGAILGVGRGSDEEPKFIVMEYRKGPKSQKPIVLVGKGVTFDTGGLNLKPSTGIYEMHMDMSGAAAVIHALVAAAKLKLKKNIIVLVPAVENMPSGSSYHPGDVLRSMAGTTIEILNTDAEGRVILTDALTYAERYKPSVVIDVATLTGAAIASVGTKASLVFSKDQKLVQQLKKLGDQNADPLWELPLWDEYEQDIKGTFGDWANTGRPGQAGSIAGALFLYQWAKNYRWAHIDMAPRMTATEGDFLAKGARGTPVALLVEFLRG